MRTGKHKQAPGVTIRKKKKAEHGSPAPQNGNIQKPTPLHTRSPKLRGVKRRAQGHTARCGGGCWNPEPVLPAKPLLRGAQPRASPREGGRKSNKDPGNQAQVHARLVPQRTERGPPPGPPCGAVCLSRPPGGAAGTSEAGSETRSPAPSGISDHTQLKGTDSWPNASRQPPRSLTFNCFFFDCAAQHEGSQLSGQRLNPQEEHGVFTSGPPGKCP